VCQGVLGCILRRRRQVTDHRLQTSHRHRRSSAHRRQKNALWFTQNPDHKEDHRMAPEPGAYQTRRLISVGIPHHASPKATSRARQRYQGLHLAFLHQLYSSEQEHWTSRISNPSMRQCGNVRLWRRYLFYTTRRLLGIPSKPAFSSVHSKNSLFRPLKTQIRLGRYAFQASQLSRHLLKYDARFA
jgi:hypothetical protein